jgi:hypothetical protein
MNILDKIISGILISPSLICIACLFQALLHLSEYENYYYSIQYEFPSLFEMFFAYNTGIVFIGLPSISGALLLSSVKLNGK